MSANCLKTSLLGEVPGYLPEFNKIVFFAEKKQTISDADLQQAMMFQFVSGGVHKFEVESPGAVGFNPATVDQSTDTFLSLGDSYSKVAFKNESYKITIENKYLLSRLVSRGGSGKVNIFKIDLSEFEYATNLQYLNLNYTSDLKGNIESLKNCPLIELKLDANTQIYGDIASLGASVNLTTFNFNFTKVSGEIVQFAEAQVAAGRTNGTLAIETNGIVTLNGEVAPILITITFDSSLPNGYSIS